MARPSFLLAERARSEGARSTRAVNDNLATPLKVVEGVKMWARVEELLTRGALTIKRWSFDTSRYSAIVCLVSSRCFWR